MSGPVIATGKDGRRFTGTLDKDGNFVRDTQITQAKTSPDSPGGSKTQYGYVGEDGSFVPYTKPMKEGRGYWGEWKARVLPDFGATMALWAHPKVALPMAFWGGAVGTSRIAGDAIDDYLETAERGNVEDMLARQPRVPDPRPHSEAPEDWHTPESAKALVDKHWSENPEFGDYAFEDYSRYLSPMETWQPAIKEGIKWAGGDWFKPGPLTDLKPSQAESLGIWQGMMETSAGSWNKYLAPVHAISAWWPGQTVDYKNEDGTQKSNEEILAESRAATHTRELIGTGVALGAGAGGGPVMRALGGMANKVSKALGGAKPAGDTHTQRVRNTFEKIDMNDAQREYMQELTGRYENLRSATGMADDISYGHLAGEAGGKKIRELEGTWPLHMKPVEAATHKSRNWIDDAFGKTGLTGGDKDLFPGGVPSQVPKAALQNTPKGARGVAQWLHNLERAAIKHQAKIYDDWISRNKDLDFEIKTFKRDQLEKLLDFGRSPTFTQPTSPVKRVYDQLLKKFDDPKLALTNKKRAKQGLDPLPPRISAEELFGAIKDLRRARINMQSGWGKTNAGPMHEAQGMLDILENMARKGGDPAAKKMIDDLDKISGAYKKDYIDVFRPHDNPWLQKVVTQLRNTKGDVSKLDTTAFLGGLVGNTGKVNVKNYKSLRAALGDDAGRNLDDLVVSNLREKALKGQGNAARRLLNFADRNADMLADESMKKLADRIVGAGDTAGTSILDDLFSQVVKSNEKDVFNTIFSDPTQVNKVKGLLGRRYGKTGMSKEGQGLASGMVADLPARLLQVKAAQYIKSLPPGKAAQTLETHRSAIAEAFKGNPNGLENLTTLAMLSDNVAIFERSLFQRGDMALEGYPSKNPIYGTMAKGGLGLGVIGSTWRNLGSAIRSAFRRQQSWEVSLGTYGAQAYYSLRTKDFINAMFHKSTTPEGAAEVASIVAGKPTEAGKAFIRKFFEGDTRTNVTKKLGQVGFDPSADRWRAETWDQDQVDAANYERWQRRYKQQEGLQ